jgi:protein-disulfide isomerase
MGALMATPGSLSEDDVKNLLTSAGIDLKQVAVAVQKNDKKIPDLLTRNYNQALAFNFTGTPSFVIGTSAFSGVVDKDQLRDLIKQARAS